MEVFFFMIRRILGEKKFVAHIGPNGYFTFSPPPYLDGALPLEASTFSSHLGPHHLHQSVALGRVGSMFML